MGRGGCVLGQEALLPHSGSYSLWLPQLPLARPARPQLQPSAPWTCAPAAPAQSSAAPRPAPAPPLTLALAPALILAMVSAPVPAPPPTAQVWLAWGQVLGWRGFYRRPEKGPKDSLVGGSGLLEPRMRLWRKTGGSPCGDQEIEGSHPESSQALKTAGQEAARACLSACAWFSPQAPARWPCCQSPTSEPSPGACRPMALATSSIQRTRTLWPALWSPFLEARAKPRTALALVSMSGAAEGPLSLA